MIPLEASISSSGALRGASTIPLMPVIVVGADTPVGLSIVSALIEPDREVRAFVTDPDVSASLKAQGVKVALGDVSDPSHVGGACLNCFSAVLVTEAARDDRERAFAPENFDDCVGERIYDRRLTCEPGRGIHHRENAVPRLDTAKVA